MCALRDLRTADDVGLYVLTLPVTTAVALAGGVELFGFPKYLASIDTSFNDDNAKVDLKGECTLTHTRGFGLTMSGTPIVTFTYLDKRLIRTVFEIGHRVRFGGARSVRIQVTGDGPTARIVMALGLDRARPAFAFRTDAMRAILPLGKDLGS